MKEIKVSVVSCEAYEYSNVYESIKKAIVLCGGFPKNIKPNTKILIKPNLLTAKTPEKAATTHPIVVKAIIKLLREHGIDDITIGDSPAGKYTWDELWKKTGFKKLAIDENVKLLAFENIENIKFEGLTIPLLKELSSFDAVINVPKLKTHSLTKYTGAVKNCYGLIVGGAKAHFHGVYPSPNKMAKFLSSYFNLIQPSFNIMDGILCMEEEGPSSGKPKHTGLIFASNNAVALDSCACEVFKYKSSDIKMLVYLNANKLNINRCGDAWNKVSATCAKRSKKADMLAMIPDSIFKVATAILSCRPKIDQNKCIKCGKCKDICSQKTIIQNSQKEFKVINKKCILCMCCIEACPCHAINLISIGMKLKQLKNCITRK